MALDSPQPLLIPVFCVFWGKKTTWGCLEPGLERAVPGIAAVSPRGRVPGATWRGTRHRPCGKGSWALRGFPAKETQLIPGMNRIKVVELEEEMMGKDGDALPGTGLGWELNWGVLGGSAGWQRG